MGRTYINKFLGSEKKIVLCVGRVTEASIPDMVMVITLSTNSRCNIYTVKIKFHFFKKVVKE